MRGKLIQALLTVSCLAGCGTAAGAEAPVVAPATTATTTTTSPVGERTPEQTGSAALVAASGDSLRTRITYPAAGGGRFTVAAAETAAPAGRAGRLKRYRVAVERDIRGVTAADFAAAVTATLRDPRSWTAGGQWRLTRVGPGGPADFTVRLVTPQTRDRLCAGAPDGYTSCRNGDRVVINVARWAKGVPGYGAPLAAYRQYVVNHEVGHALGQAHELCPARGALAPVMQQQTLGMHGCTPNAWPYLRGDRYRGRIGAYDDPVPRRESGRG
ncbi:DUF3152 domain-containing protein [Actinoplanes sp. NPDC051851]|uniref:DUF3152 domain-containing protein n=1 Tax=Actinoplanes sp. NPDC051851 TaxID=3154753 RepID=UPI003436328C